MSLLSKFPYSQLSDEQAAKVEARLGRKLTPSERIMGQLIRKEQHGFGPVKIALLENENPLDRQLREAQAAVEAEKYASMTKAQRALYQVEQARAKDRAAQAAQVAHGEKLKLMKPMLDQLDALIEDARFDPNYSYLEVEALWNAKAQIEAQGACPVAAEQMFAACVAARTEKDTAKRTEAQQQLAELQLKASEMQAVVDAMTPKAEKPAEPSVYARAIEQLDTLTKLVALKPQLDAFLAAVDAGEIEVDESPAAE